MVIFKEFCFGHKQQRGVFQTIFVNTRKQQKKDILRGQYILKTLHVRRVCIAGNTHERYFFCIEQISKHIPYQKNKTKSFFKGDTPVAGNSTKSVASFSQYPLKCAKVFSISQKNARVRCKLTFGVLKQRNVAFVRRLNHQNFRLPFVEKNNILNVVCLKTMRLSS